MTTRNKYCMVRVPGRSGWYFQRRVPSDLAKRKAFGKRVMWRWKLSNDEIEARRGAMDSLLQTDRWIAEARGDTATLQKLVSDHVVPGLAAAMERQGVTAAELYPRLDLDEADVVVQIETGSQPIWRTFDELIKVNERLKNPSPLTIRSWQQRAKEVDRVLNTQDVSAVTKAMCRRYRDYMLDTCAPTTTKNRIRELKSMFNVAVEEGWLTSNPWDVINVKRIRGRSKQKDDVRLDSVDAVVTEKLSPDQELVYWIMRYTGTHISEAAGVLHGDIDLKRKVIQIRPNDLRPVKTAYRTRELPIIDKLMSHLERLYQPGTASKHVFPGFFNGVDRWGDNFRWGKKLGISAKACRDAATTVMREADINERVIGALLGHTPKNATGAYGTVSMESKINALNVL